MGEFVENDCRVNIEAGLASLLYVQECGARLLPASFQILNDEDFRTAALALIVEIGELVNESRWKPWRNYSSEVSSEERERVLDEFADVLHMLAWMMRNAAVRFDFTTEDVTETYLAKARENRARFSGQVVGREPRSELQSGETE